jgi:hypothetical protein
MTFVAARISRGETSTRARSQRSRHAALLASTRAAERRELGHHDPAVAVRAGALDVARLRQAVEHLCDGGGRDARGQRELPGRELPALVELDHQLELRVAELGPGQVRVASAHAADRPEQVAERDAERVQLGGDVRARRRAGLAFDGLR